MADQNEPESPPANMESWRKGLLRHSIPTEAELEARAEAGDDEAINLLNTHRVLGTFKK
jgi:hypothetical protein